MKRFCLLGLCACFALADVADERPIGVFDSGLGGLTVLERLLDCDLVNNETGEPGADGIPDFAHERFVYLGDQANMPYGDYAAAGKSDLLKELVVDDARFLLGTSFCQTAREKVPTGRKDRAKILVIACNTATAWGLEEIRSRLKAAGDDTQVVGVIEAGVQAALDILKVEKTSPSFAVGVLATPGTIASGAYTRTLRRELAARGVACEVPVYGQGCAGLADAVESCSPAADRIAVDNLKKMLEQHRAAGSAAPLRAVILGCTHFPFVQAALEKALAEARAKGANVAPDCSFVDPAIYTAAACYRLLKQSGQLAKTWQPAPSAAFLSVADPDQAQEHLAPDGQLTRAFKYGRSIAARVGTTKPVPFTHANFKPEVFRQVGRLLPRTAALLEMPPVTGPRKIVAVAEMCTTNGIVSSKRTCSDAVLRAGCIPLIVPRTADTNVLAQVLDRADALLLTGGSKLQDYRGRMAFEHTLIGLAMVRNKPVLGFCHGHQAINTFFGGTLELVGKKASPAVVHRGARAATVFSDTFHAITVDPQSKLAQELGATNFIVNSSHTRRVGEVGKGLKVVARAPDGTVESIEHETLPIRGFQFHPERCIDRDVRFTRIIRSALGQ